MKKKLALLMTAIVSTSALALAGCKTNIGWIDEKICKHEYEFVRITLEPTCTEEGERLMECVDCGKQKTEVMEKIPHDENVTPGKDATCTEDGYTEKIVCNVCQEVLAAQTVVPATGHKDENADDLCDSCGDSMSLEVEVGDYVVGPVYRIYKNPEASSQYFSFNISTESSYLIMNHDSQIKLTVRWSDMTFISSPLALSTDIVPFEIIETVDNGNETYIEFVIKTGEFCLDDEAFVVDGNSDFTEISSGCMLYYVDDE